MERLLLAIVLTFTLIIFTELKWPSFAQTTRVINSQNRLVFNFKHNN